MRSYFSYLKINRHKIQPMLDQLINEKLQISPFRNGYIDLIASRQDFPYFVVGLTQLGIAISSVTWWCHCTEENKKRLGCPHGLGGPVSRLDDSWYSEICINDYDVPEDEIKKLQQRFSPGEVKKINDSVLNDISKLMNTQVAPQFSPCYTPGVWVLVPEDWQSQ